MHLAAWRDRDVFRFAVLALLIVIAPAMSARSSAARSCPTSADEIDPDRPDVTNSPLAVPRGSFQIESGVASTWYVGSTIFDATETRLRLGIADCFELVLDTPSYSYALDRGVTSGFGDTVLSFKRELPALYGIDSGAAAGLAFSSGSPHYSGRGYDPFIQWSWSRDLPGGWGAGGMFSLFWFTSRSGQNPTFEPTFEITRNLLPTLGSFVEYVGDYPNHAQASQVIDAGATLRVARLQQVDFRFGLGLNRASPDHFVGIGYSIRLDHLF